MKCDDCEAETATIHITRTVEGEHSGIDLCETCAGQHGYDAENPATISTVLDSTEALHKRREPPRAS
jgi:protein-arginine kinase activator protein McsA